MRHIHTILRYRKGSGALAGGLSLIFLLLCNSCKFVYYNVPDIDDHRIFPYRTVYSDTANAFRFHRARDVSVAGQQISVNDKSLGAKLIGLEEFCDQTKTAAFLIIRNDSIIYEYYDGESTEQSIFNPFSITKSFITTLTGIALLEGKLHSLDDPVAKYLPEFRNSPVGEVKLRHLLKHCSGIHFADNNLNPFAGNAKYYYGSHLRRYLHHLRLYTEPGCEYKYSSANTQLLALAIEQAVGTTLSAYLEDRLWKAVGMQYNAYWSMDSRGDWAMERAFSGLNAVPVDLAKLGRLYLHHGRCDGRQIIPEVFVQEALCRDATEGSRWDYQYNFGVGPEEYGTFYAVGLFGQLIYVYPKKNVIIVRLVHHSTPYNPPFVYHTMLQVIDQL